MLHNSDIHVKENIYCSLFYLLKYSKTVDQNYGIYANQVVHKRNESRDLKNLIHFFLLVFSKS